jgi:CRP/FNR family transcriptional regulator, anaerobic regulatory protein
MNLAQVAWRDLFPALDAGDAETRAVMDAARTLAMAPHQPVFLAGSPCENYVLLLAGNVRVQIIGEGGREAVLYLCDSVTEVPP